MRRLDSGEFVMCYTLNWTSTFSARSSNGLTFTNDASVRMSPGGHPSSALENVTNMLSCLVQFPDGRVRAYYQGSPTTDILNPARVFSALVSLRSAEDRPGCLPAVGWTKEDFVRLQRSGNKSYVSPSVLHRPDGSLQMYISAYPQDEIRRATSPDGLRWTEIDTVADSGTFSDTIRSAHVIELSSGQLRMYVDTRSGDRVLSALSSNGTTWTAEAGVRLVGAQFPRVVSAGTGYRMYYGDPISGAIASAFSLDGLTWSAEGSRIANAVHPATTIFADGSIVLCYTDPAEHEIRSARSVDGLNFTLDPGFRLVPGGPDGTGTSGTMGPGALVQFFDGTVRLYYAASDRSSILDHGSIYSAVACYAELTSDRAPITVNGGLRRYYLRGEPGKWFILVGSMSGMASSNWGCVTRNPLVKDDYYRQTAFAGDPWTSPPSGLFGPSGTASSVFQVPAGALSAGESVWHILESDPSACSPAPGVIKAAGRIASNASNPIRITVQ